MDVVTGKAVVQQRDLKLLRRLPELQPVGVSVAGEFEEEPAIVTAVSQVIDLAGDEIAVGSGDTAAANELGRPSIAREYGASKSRARPIWNDNEIDKRFLSNHLLRSDPEPPDPEPPNRRASPTKAGRRSGTARPPARRQLRPEIRPRSGLEISVVRTTKRGSDSDRSGRAHPGRPRLHVSPLVRHQRRPDPDLAQKHEGQGASTGLDVPCENKYDKGLLPCTTKNRPPVRLPKHHLHHQRPGRRPALPGIFNSGEIKTRPFDVRGLWPALQAKEAIWRQFGRRRRKAHRRGVCTDRLPVHQVGRSLDHVVSSGNAWEMEL